MPRKDVCSKQYRFGNQARSDKAESELVTHRNIQDSYSLMWDSISLSQSASVLRYLI